MTTYHVFGDTGGHHKQLLQGLIEVGLNPETYKLPNDTIIIHCGDLIHKGPASHAVMKLVDNIMTANPGQWVQLLGNHEFQYIKGAPVFWADTIDIESQMLLGSWLQKKQVHVAYAIPASVEIHQLSQSARGFETPDKGMLFTHAGLNYDFWVKYLNKEEDVVEVAKLINNLPIKQVTTPGSMLGGFSHNYKPVGPVWALSTDEVWGSWQGKQDMPFIQVHGHTTPYSYGANRWWPAPKGFTQAAKVNPVRKTLAVRVANSLQIGVDPGYSKTAAAGPQPALKITTVEKSA